MIADSEAPEVTCGAVRSPLVLPGVPHTHTWACCHPHAVDTLLLVAVLATAT